MQWLDQGLLQRHVVGANKIQPARLVLHYYKELLCQIMFSGLH